MPKDKSQLIKSKYHLYVSLFLGLWVYFFLVFIGPFDSFSLGLIWRAQIMLGYGIIFSLSYLTIIPIEKWLFGSLGKWNFFLELIMVFLIFLISFFPIYFYYKSEWILGEYILSDFIFKIYLSSVIILFPLVLFVRWAIVKISLKFESPNNKLSIIGENKLDILHLSLNDLIYAKSVDNYVEIHYLQNDFPHMKIMRSSLKKIKKQIPQLTKVHRSYLINITHFIGWKDKKTIYLVHAEIPVTDKYKDILLEHPKFIP